MSKIDPSTLIKSKGLKLTIGRLELVNLLLKSGAPLSAEQMIKRLKKLDRANIYRNIKELLEVGLIREVPLHHLHQHYEIVTPKDHHHHLICRECSSVEEVEFCLISKKTENSLIKKSKLFKTVDQHSLDFYGLCNRCARIKK